MMTPEEIQDLTFQVTNFEQRKRERSLRNVCAQLGIEWHKIR